MTAGKNTFPGNFLRIFWQIVCRIVCRRNLQLDWFVHFKQNFGSYMMFWSTRLSMKMVRNRLTRWTSNKIDVILNFIMHVLVIITNWRMIRNFWYILQILIEKDTNFLHRVTSNPWKWLDRRILRSKEIEWNSKSNVPNNVKQTKTFP